MGAINTSVNFSPTERVLIGHLTFDNGKDFALFCITRDVCQVFRFSDVSTRNRCGCGMAEDF